MSLDGNWTMLGAEPRPWTGGHTSPLDQTVMPKAKCVDFRCRERVREDSRWQLTDGRWAHWRDEGCRRGRETEMPEPPPLVLHPSIFLGYVAHPRLTACQLWLILQGLFAQDGQRMGFPRSQHSQTLVESRKRAGIGCPSVKSFGVKCSVFTNAC